MKDNVVIVIVGPTAIGKTSLSIQLAQHFRTSIISADSRQCYKELNIGVAKPSPQQLNAVNHYFINTHSIHDDVNAAAFEEYALRSIEKIFETNRLAIMVGGTGLYIKAFCEGLDSIPQIPKDTRETVIMNYNLHGISWLHQELARLDPEYFALAEKQNPQRLMRALEVKLVTGDSISSFQSQNKKKRNFSIIKIGLEKSRDELYAQINSRVDQMVEAGLFEEARTLHPFSSLNALQTVGYSEIFEHLSGTVSRDETITLIKKHTRHYAKRQITWFKKDPGIHWFEASQVSSLLNFLSETLGTDNLQNRMDNILP